MIGGMRIYFTSQKMFVVECCEWTYVEFERCGEYFVVNVVNSTYVGEQVRLYMSTKKHVKYIST